MAGRNKGKYKQTVRVFGMLSYLRAHSAGATVEALADEFEITTRQVDRDVEALELCGHEVERRLPEDGPMRLCLRDPPLKDVRISLSERFALMAARRAFDVIAGTPLHGEIQKVYARIADTLPPTQRAELQAMGDRFVYLPDGGTKPYRKSNDALNGLMTGVLRRLHVKYVYVRADGKKRTGVLEPYAMAVYRQGLYVIGRPASGERGEGKGAIRVYAAERFSKAEHVRNSHFELPTGFAVDKYFQGAFGIFVGDEQTRVVVELSAAARATVEARSWHPSQKLKRLPDGTVRLTFEVPNTTQVLPWVLSWGDHARVIEPCALAEEVHDIAKRMSAGERARHLSKPPPPMSV